MPVGTPLSVLRQMLNAETGQDMDEVASPGSVPINNQLLNNQQFFLCNQHAYLRGKTRVTFPLVSGQQFFPTSTPVNGTPLEELIDLDRPETTEFVNFSNFRYRLLFGIGQNDYNIYNSVYGMAGVPVMRWDMVQNQYAVTAPGASYPGGGAVTLTYTGLIPGQRYTWNPGINEVSLVYNGVTFTAQDTFSVVTGVTTAVVTGLANAVPFTGQLNTIGRVIEVWPIPSVPQTLELAGVVPINLMENDTDVCVIDDYLLVLFTAGEMLARSGLGDASAKITKAKAHLDALKSSYPNRLETFNLSGGYRHIAGFHNGKGRPVIAVSMSPAH